MNKINNLKISIHELGKSFDPKTKKMVFNIAEITLDHPQILWITGKNGSGKTTLLRTLATLLSPDKGDANIFGYSLKHNSKSILPTIGYLNAQTKGFFNQKSGQENLDLFSMLRFTKKFETTTYADDFRRIECFQQALEKKFEDCSTGMKQLLLMASATLHQPRLLLLDEPFKALDKKNTKWLCQFLENYAKNNFIILTSHTDELMTHKIHARQYALD